MTLNTKMQLVLLMAAAACASNQRARLSGTAKISYALPKTLLRELFEGTADRVQDPLPPGQSALASCGQGSCRLRIGQTRAPLMSGSKHIGTTNLTYETELPRAQIDVLLRAIEVSRLHKGRDIMSATKQGDAKIVCLSTSCQIEHLIKFDQDAEVRAVGPQLFFGPAFWVGLLKGLRL